MVDRWIHFYSPERVVQALAPQLTEERRARLEEVLAHRLAGLTVVLENLHDPHNGAAALRSVEGFGLTSLHVIEQAEPFRFSSKVTQGCEKWVDIGRHPDVESCVRALRARGFRLWAAVPGGGRSIDDLDVTHPAALVFGNEHAGLSAEAVAACDGTFEIPMAGFTRSFNLSVSVAISVYETARRRRAALGTPGDLPQAELAQLRARFYALSMDERAARGIVDRS